MGERPRTIESSNEVGLTNILGAQIEIQTQVKMDLCFDGFSPLKPEESRNSVAKSDESSYRLARVLKEVNYPEDVIPEGIDWMFEFPAPASILEWVCNNVSTANYVSTDELHRYVSAFQSLDPKYNSKQSSRYEQLRQQGLILEVSSLYSCIS